MFSWLFLGHPPKKQHKSSVGQAEININLLSRTGKCVRMLAVRRAVERERPGTNTQVQFMGVRCFSFRSRRISDEGEPLWHHQTIPTSVVFSPGAVPVDYLSRPAGSCGRRWWQGGHYSLTGVWTPENADAGAPSFMERIGFVHSCIDVTAGSRVKILSFVFEKLNGWIRHAFCTRTSGHVSRVPNKHQIFSMWDRINLCFNVMAVGL